MTVLKYCSGSKWSRQRDITAARLHDALAELLGGPQLPHAAMEDIGLDQLGALWLQHHLQQQYGFYIEPAALMQLSIFALAFQVANVQSSAATTSPDPGQDLVIAQRDIEKQLARIS